MAVSSVWHPSDGSFVKAVRKRGDGLYTPTEGSTCTVTLACTQESLCNMNSGYPIGEETSVVIGEGDTEVSEIIDKCLMSMREGESCGVMFAVFDGHVVKGKEAEGCRYVTLEIYLKDFTREPTWDVDVEMRLKRTRHHKDRGTELFRANRKEAAFQRYSQAAKYLISAGPQKAIPENLMDIYKNLTVQVHLNLAACQMQYENYSSVITNCSRALEIDKGNIKGLYRRGVAYSRLKDWERAQADLNKVLSTEPGNRAAIREMMTVQERLREDIEKDKFGQLTMGMQQMFR